MPWYYAGPEAKPLGPVSLDELNALRARGILSPDTYVIEHTGQPEGPGPWRRYREVFPASASLVLPPLPPQPVAGIPAPHPLFPSAHLSPISLATPAVTGHAGTPVLNAANPHCKWGFGLGLASLILLLPSCGLTTFLAVVAIVISIMGLVQLHHRRDQKGRGLALAGLFFSALTLLVMLVVLVAFAVPSFKAHEQTATEQSPNDSE